MCYDIIALVSCRWERVAWLKYGPSCQRQRLLHIHRRNLVIKADFPDLDLYPRKGIVWVIEELPARRIIEVVAGID